MNNRFLLVLACLGLTLAAAANVRAESESPASFTSAQLSQASDQQLTALAASWGKLNPGQRRVLLAEMRTRMTRSRNQAELFRQKLSQQRQASQSSRQYGRVIREVRQTRQPDGTIVVETRVVRVRPKQPEAATGSREVAEQTVKSNSNPNSSPGKDSGYRERSSSRVTFGIGFERRRQAPSSSEHAHSVDVETQGDSARP